LPILREIPSQRDKDTQEVKEVLQRALTEGLDSVILFAFKDGAFTVEASSCEDIIHQIGALEVAKQILWTSMEGSYEG
jgi:hypothetical protein